MMEHIMPVLSSIGTLALLVAIFVGAYFVSKMLGKRYQGMQPGGSLGNIEIIEQRVIGQGQSLVIAKVTGRIFLLGVTAQGIQKIEELDASTLTEKPENSMMNQDFKTIFKETWHKNVKDKWHRNKAGNRENQDGKH